MASTTTPSARAQSGEVRDTARTATPGRQPIVIKPFRVFVYVLLTVGALIFVLPFFWMVSTSLQSVGDITRGRAFPTSNILNVSEVTETELNRTLQDLLDSGEFPSYLQGVRGQIESSNRQRQLTVDQYLRTQRYGYAELRIKNEIPGLKNVWPFDKRYVVVGGLAHYIEAWDESNFSEYFFNSVQIAALTIIGQTITSVLAAYAFARIEFPGRNLLFSLFLATIFIPTMVVLIPNRKTVTEFHNFFTQDFPAKQDTWGLTDARRAVAEPLYDVVDALGLENFLGLGDALTVDGPIVWPWMDNWPALVVPFLASTFSIFLLRQFFMQIPEDLWDAARIDGAGHLRYLFLIVLPISRAALITTILFTFIGTWNALEWPILVTFTDNWRPISYGLYAFKTEAGSDLNLLMAGSVITLVPVLVLYLFAQRQFTEGIATTGLKG